MLYIWMPPCICWPLTYCIMHIREVLCHCGLALASIIIIWCNIYIYCVATCSRGKQNELIVAKTQKYVPKSLVLLAISILKLIVNNWINVFSA